MRIRNLKNTDELIKDSAYLVQDYKDYINKWKTLFNNDNPIHLEIGMGKGDFIINMALKYPEINFIGLELHTNVIARATKKLREYNINNLKLINANALELNEIFNHEIDLVYLNFSDPWPKKRYAKRRLTSEIFLNLYDGIFKDKKEIKLKTDNTLLFESSLVSMSNYGYVFDEVSLDYNDEDNVETEYESKFRKMGIKINYLYAHKK